MAAQLEPGRVRFQENGVSGTGVMQLPDDPLGIVIFAGGDESSRARPPGDYVASVLCKARLGVLWLDNRGDGAAETPAVANDATSLLAAVDVGQLMQRLACACIWLRGEQATCDLPIGLFCTGVGAAAALQLAGEPGNCISALVTRGGRPDFARYGALPKITAPTLMIVGGLDEDVMELNRTAYAALICQKRFEIIPGATHRFDEAGCLEVVARLSRNWFLQHSRFALE